MLSKRPSSERRIAASRANGAHSRGPITPEGKRNSSRNAIRHGLRSNTVTVQGESAKRFADLLCSLRAELQPETDIETALVDNMAVARWRQMRVWGMETAGITNEIRRQEAANQQETPATQAFLAFRTLSDQSRSLELMNRYEARFDRQYARTLERFLDLRSRRRAFDPAEAELEKTFFPDEPDNLQKTEPDCE